MRHGLQALLALFLFALTACDGKGDERLRNLYRDDAMVVCRAEAAAAAPALSSDAVRQACRCAIDRDMAGKSGVELRLRRDAVGHQAHRAGLAECLARFGRGAGAKDNAAGSPRQALRVQMKQACLAQAVSPDQTYLRQRAEQACECAVGRYVRARSDRQLTGERPFEDLLDDLTACVGDTPPPPVRAHLDEIRANGIDACVPVYARDLPDARGLCTCAADRFLSRPADLELARLRGQMPFVSDYRADITACRRERGAG